MAPTQPVLISLHSRVAEQGSVRARLEEWVGEYGFEPRFTTDPQETLAWSQEEPFAANLLDAELEMLPGQSIWRVLQPRVGRRMVLMTGVGRTDLWFEALRCGIAAVLALPPEASSVHAALRAATRQGERLGSDRPASRDVAAPNPDLTRGPDNHSTQDRWRSR